MYALILSQLIFLVLQHAALAQLYNFTTFTWTPCGATGRSGPLLAQVRQNYSRTTWTQNNAYLTMDPEYPGMQIWTVPVTGRYRITAAGAAGGGLGSGQGAILSGEFDLIEGDKYFVLVGQRGSTGCGSARCSNSGGGGGASGVFRYFPFDEVTIPISSGSGGTGGIVTINQMIEVSPPEITYETIPAGSPVMKAQRTAILKEYLDWYTLIVAGGGGGGNGDASTGDVKDPPNGDGRTWFSTGESTYDYGAGRMGYGAYGSVPYFGAEFYWAGGGAGLLENGTDGDAAGKSTGGQSLIEGAAGGKGGSTKANISPSGHGGFGGGGGATAVSAVRGGGGGGIGGGMGGAYNIDPFNYVPVDLNDAQSAEILANPLLMIQNDQIDYNLELPVQFPPTIYMGSSQPQEGYGGGGGSFNLGFKPNATVNPVKEAGYVTITIISCGPGMFMSNGMCRGCPAGTFSQSGATSCIFCSSGTFSSAKSESCLRCSVGSFSTAGASTCTCLAGYELIDGSCSLCAAGFYKASSGNTACLKCSTNTESTYNRTSCLACRSNSITTANSTSCQCLPGYSLINGACAACPTGSFKSTIGDEVCTLCSANTFSATPGSTSCQQCQNAVSTLGSATCTCNAGFYKLNGACTACPLGSSKATVGDGSCSLCSAGQFQEATGATTCKSCSAGTFQSAAGASSCNLCPSGTFSTTFGATSDIVCQKCPINTFSSSFGASSSSVCIACAANSSTQNRLGVNDSTLCVCNMGFQWSGTSCNACAINYYKSNEGNTNCLACGANAITNGITGSSVCYCPKNYYGDPKVQCTACPPNTYQTSLLSSTSDSIVCASALSCRAGSYGDPSAGCQTCPVSTYRSGISYYITTLNDCVKCAMNASSVSGATSATQCLCDAGFYGDGSNSCSPCPTNTYKPTVGNGGIGVCLPCTANSTTLGLQGSTNIDACVCNAGYSGSGSTLCTACLPGLFKPTTGNGLCTKCAAGTFQNSSGATSCQSCSGNTFQSNEGSATCLACGTNAVVDSEKTSCFCLPNTVGDPTKSCTSCPVNYLRPGSTTKITSFIDCMEAPSCGSGYYGIPGSCLKCPVDTYRTGVAYTTMSLSSCIACPQNTGTNGLLGAMSILACVCNAGYFGNGSASCTICLENTYKPAGNALSCTPCPTRTSTNGIRGASGIELCVCEKGFFGLDTTSCQLCPTNTYKSTKGFAPNCTSCPFKSVTNGETGMTNVDSCLCVSGHYYNIVSGSCEICPTNTFKTGVGNVNACTSCPVSSGTMGRIGAIRRLDCVCDEEFLPLGDRCVQGCGIGATLIKNSTICQCLPGYYPKGSECLPCPFHTFKGDFGNQTCTSCATNGVLEDLGSVSSEGCQCAPGYFGDGAVACYECPENSFQPSAGNFQSCFKCPSGLGSNGLTAAVKCALIASTKETPAGTKGDDDSDESASGLLSNPTVLYSIVGAGSLLVMATVAGAIIIHRKRKQQQQLGGGAGGENPIQNGNIMKLPQESAMAMLNSSQNILSGQSGMYLGGMPMNPGLMRQISTNSLSHGHNVISKSTQRSQTPTVFVPIFPSNSIPSLTTVNTSGTSDSKSPVKLVNNTSIFITNNNSIVNGTNNNSSMYATANVIVRQAGGSTKSPLQDSFPK